MFAPMDDLDEIRLRMRISNLQAKLELRELETLALSREISSPLTASQRRSQAVERRDDMLTERSEITKKLDES